MAALNAVGQARIAANGRVTSNSLSSTGGASSGSYLGGINPATYPAAGHDVPNNSLNVHTNFQMSNNHPGVSASSSVVNTSFLDPPVAQPSPARNPAQTAMQLRQRQQVFLNGLANVMAKRNTPLPPALTGMPTPDYDSTNSPWKLIEPSSEVGSFRLAGKDVNLFKLWGLVQHHGGGHSITSKNGWSVIAAQFDLPEEFPQPQANGSTSVANMLLQYYMAILYPFEELYKRNLPDHQRRVQMVPRTSGSPFQTSGAPMLQGRPLQGLPTAGQAGSTGQMQRAAGNHVTSMGQPMGIVHGPMTGSNQVPQAAHTPQTPSQRPPSAALAPHALPGGPGNLASVTQADNLSVPQLDASHELVENVLDQDIQGIKRKIEFEEGMNKRARQKTEPPENAVLPVVRADRTSADTSGASSEAIQRSVPTLDPTRPRQPLRRKIEYVPLAREIDTYGGRDLQVFETEFANIVQRRPLRDINDWGIVDIEALAMSLRSRLSAELSYALTTLTILSTMRGPTQGTGLPLVQCLDMFDELLDLLEDMAFEDVQDTSGNLTEDDTSIPTNRELVNIVIDSESRPFAALQAQRGMQNPELGLRQRPDNLILIVSNIIRNFSLIFDNAKFISQHERALPILFRLCSMTRGEEGSLRPLSPVLSMSDVIAVRKDVLLTLVNTAPFIDLAQNRWSSDFILGTKRVFHLLTSYLIDSAEAVSPYGLVQLNGSLKPPFLADVALEVFTRLSQSDSNRQIIAQAVPQTAIRRLFESLIHRLPVVDADFQLITREPWMGYVEKTIMATYSLAFLAPPTLKQALKKDRKLGFKTVMLRIIRKFLVYSDQKMFMVGARRAVEAMKMLDDGEDLFDTSQSTAPTLSFGMGYGEVGDNGVERGTGLLGGHREMAWEMLMHREVLIDEVMFRELESLARVECA
ncbi:hypothetical protein AX17_000102 [Amanita inopinata Kibby_2008]|nr:hypothetical protein AX17_000102 [Amanita inopinata Kibby_2008]